MKDTTKQDSNVGPPPPPRSASTKHDSGNMAAIYKQQYGYNTCRSKEDIFEHNSTSGTPITYKAPPVAPPKPDWPPPPSQNERMRSPMPDSPGSMNVASVWPPKKSSAVDMPRTGFNPAAVREQGTGRRCVWPPPADEYRSGRNTPQSPSVRASHPMESLPFSPRHSKSTVHQPLPLPCQEEGPQLAPTCCQQLCKRQRKLLSGQFLSRFVARGVVSYVRCVITSRGFVLQKPDPIAGSPDAPFRGQEYGSQCVGHVDLAATANGFFPFRLRKATAVH
ncbi:PDZ domain-containing protein [Caerostris extrusa]|uniref:PDZ domain-containing protein n=1 Tax=Caerostris extrusa TaxID=172846 RepID=A0AAV4UYY4_CAEEX|nr:PDZ domain-containing protein [Caerostris extrusa]